MDFSRLPDTAFLKIFEYLPIEDCIRSGRVDKTFRRIAQLTTSHTKSLDLREDRFRKLTSVQLAVILDLCSPNLERIEFPSRNTMENPRAATDWENWRQRADILDNHGRELATKFSNYECPRLTDINLGHTPIDQAVFEQLIRNNPNMESLIWSVGLLGFPADVTNNNLKKLDVRAFNDAALQSLVGRCPNLKELNLVTLFSNIAADVLDQFFDSIPQVNRISICIAEDGPANEIEFERDLVSFWKLPLTWLSIDFPDAFFPEDSFVTKLASSFPNLQKLHLKTIEPTNTGIGALAALEELQILELHIYDYGGKHFDQGIRLLAYCKKLQKLGVSATNVIGGTLVNILRSCPQLDHVVCWEITQVANPEEAAVVLGSLAGIPKRDISIEFSSSDNVARIKSIWDSEPVKDMIGKLEENDGLKIKVTWGEGAGYNSGLGPNLGPDLDLDLELELDLDSDSEELMEYA